jgi:hypothetical protein
MAIFWVGTGRFQGYIGPVQDYIDRVVAADVAAGNTLGLEVGVRDAYDVFIRDSIDVGDLGTSGGVLSQANSIIKAAPIMAGAQTLQGALVPLVGAAPTNVGGLFVAGDYNRKTGLVGDGSSKGLDSNRANNADPQDSNHNAVFISTLGNSGTTYIGSGADEFNNNMARTGGNPNNMSTRSRSVNTPVVGGGIVTGFVGTSRSASGSYGFRFGGSTATVSASSNAPSSNGVSVFYNSGTNSAYSNARLAFYSIGESLDLALLDARVTALINAFDAAI